MIVRNVARDLVAGAIPTTPLSGVRADGAGLYESPPLPAGTIAGLDVLVVPPDVAFPVHVHAGHHVLYVIAGAGTVLYEGETYRTGPGDLVVIPAEVEHNVAAGPSGQTILAFGVPHRPVYAADRMRVVGGTD